MPRLVPRVIRSASVSGIDSQNIRMLTLIERGQREISPSKNILRGTPSFVLDTQNDQRIRLRYVILAIRDNPIRREGNIGYEGLDKIIRNSKKNTKLPHVFM